MTFDKATHQGPPKWEWYSPRFRDVLPPCYNVTPEDSSRATIEKVGYCRNGDWFATYVVPAKG